MDGRRVVHDDAGLLFAALAEPDAPHADPSARFDGVAKVGVEPTVDERVVADGRHGQPVADEKRRRIVTRRRFRGAHVAHQMVDVERQPAQRKQRNDNQQLQNQSEFHF